MCERVRDGTVAWNVTDAQGELIDTNDISKMMTMKKYVQAVDRVRFLS